VCGSRQGPAGNRRRKLLGALARSVPGARFWSGPAVHQHKAQYHAPHRADRVVRCLQSLERALKIQRRAGQPVECGSRAHNRERHDQDRRRYYSLSSHLPTAKDGDGDREVSGASLFFGLRAGANAHFGGSGAGIC
jgi:hypothetical protein